AAGDHSAGDEAVDRRQPLPDRPVADPSRSGQSAGGLGGRREPTQPRNLRRLSGEVAGAGDLAEDAELGRRLQRRGRIGRPAAGRPGVAGFRPDRRPDGPAGAGGRARGLYRLLPAPVRKSVAQPVPAGIHDRPRGPGAGLQRLPRRPVEGHLRPRGGSYGCAEADGLPGGPRGQRVGLLQLGGRREHRRLSELRRRSQHRRRGAETAVGQAEPGVRGRARSRHLHRHRRPAPGEDRRLRRRPEIRRRDLARLAAPRGRTARPVDPDGGARGQGARPVAPADQLAHRHRRHRSPGQVDPARTVRRSGPARDAGHDQQGLPGRPLSRGLLHRSGPGRLMISPRSIAMTTLRNGVMTLAAFAALAIASTASAQTIEKTVKVAPGGLYEIVFNPADNDLDVAAVGPRGANQAQIVRLQGQTLEPESSVDVSANPLFGLNLNTRTQVLYGTDTRSGVITAINARTGEVIATIRNGDEEGAHVRQVVVDEANNKVYIRVVGGEAGDAAKPNLIWVLDGATTTVERTITATVGGLTGAAL